MQDDAQPEEKKEGTEGGAPMPGSETPAPTGDEEKKPAEGQPEQPAV